MKGQCLSCHKDVGDHATPSGCPTPNGTWRPSPARPAIRPGTTRRVNLRLYEGTAARQASEKVGVPQFVKLTNWADATGAGLDGRALWSLLQEFNRGNGEGKTVLRGRLEVQTGVQAHQLGEKALAAERLRHLPQAKAPPRSSPSR